MTNTEAKIYTEILRLKETTIGPIIKITGLHRGTVYNTINNLIKKGFVSFVDKDRLRYYRGSGKKIFENLIEEREQDINNKKNEIKEFFDYMNKFKDNIDEGNVEVFHGVESFKSLFLEIFDRCQENNYEYIFQGRGGEMYDVTGEGFDKYTQNLKKKLNIKCRLIVDKETINHPYHDHLYGNTKYLSKGISPVNSWIYGDILLLVLFRTKPLTIIKIKSKNLADSFRDNFEYLWKIAKPINYLKNNCSDPINNSSSYTNISPIQIVQSEVNYHTLYFNNLAERRDFLDEFELLAIPKLKNKIRISMFIHGYYPISNQRKIKEKMEWYRKYKIKVYRICKGNTEIDKIAASIWDMYGAKTKLGINFNGDSSFIVFDDYIWQMINNKHLKEMDKIFNSSNFKLNKYYFDFMDKFYYKKSRIKVIIQKNPALAKMIREQVLSYFK